MERIKSWLAVLFNPKLHLYEVDVGISMKGEIVVQRRRVICAALLVTNFKDRTLDEVEAYCEAEGWGMREVEIPDGEKWRYRK